jgi:hypothetical protein
MNPTPVTTPEPTPYWDGFEWELEVDRGAVVTITSWRAREPWARADAKRTTT